MHLNHRALCEQVIAVHGSDQAKVFRVLATSGNRSEIQSRCRRVVGIARVIATTGLHTFLAFRGHHELRLVVERIHVGWTAPHA